MICEKCGAEISTEQCYNCGHVQGGANYVPQSATQATKGSDGFLTEQSLASKNGLVALVKTGDWFKLWGIGFLLNLVPFVGAIASIIYYIVLLCRDSTAESIKSYIKFRLILSIVILLISIVVVGVVFAVGFSAVSVFNGKVKPTTSADVDSIFNLS